MNLLGNLANRMLLCSALAVLAACEKPAAELELITPSQELDRIVAEQIVALVEEDSGIEITLIPPPAAGKPRQVPPQISDEINAGKWDVSDVEAEMVGDFMKKYDLKPQKKH